MQAEKKKNELHDWIASRMEYLKVLMLCAARRTESERGKETQRRPCHGAWTVYRQHFLTFHTSCEQFLAFQQQYSEQEDWVIHHCSRHGSALTDENNQCHPTRSSCYLLSQNCIFLRLSILKYIHIALCCQFKSKIVL